MTTFNRVARPFVVAHRGVRTDADPQRMAPENTIPAFQEAARQGAAIELDVMLDANGNDVVFHDLKTGRIFELAGKQQPVHETPWADLANARLNVKGHENTVGKMMGDNHYKTPDRFLNTSTPKLDAVLDAVPDSHIFVELKPTRGNRDQLTRKVMRTIAEKHAQDRVTLISFDSASLRQVKKLDPKTPTALNFELPQMLRNNKAFLWGYINLFAKKWVKADGIQPNYQTATPTLVNLGHQASLAVVPWVNQETRAEEQKKFPELITMGVDGIITNAVDLLTQAWSKAAIGKLSTDSQDSQNSQDYKKWQVG
jgi:glycerophosphoryl diester phosphodiesterase